MPGRRNWKRSDEHHEKNASLSDLSELDKARAAFVRQYLGLKWLDPYLHDVMFNTGTGYSFVADMLVRCAQGVPGADPSTFAQDRFRSHSY